MTTQTLDKTEIDETTTEASTSRSTEEKPVKAKRPWRLPRREKSSGDCTSTVKSGAGLAARAPVLVWSAFFRVIVLVADYLLASVTVMAIIPSLAAWLHAQSGAASRQLTLAGTVAMWGAPLLFAVLLIAAGEIAVMRGLWRWSSRMIQAIKDGRAEAIEAEAAVKAKSGSSRPAAQKKTNRKRGK